MRGLADYRDLHVVRTGKNRYPKALTVADRGEFEDEYGNYANCGRVKEGGYTRPMVSTV